MSDEDNVVPFAPKDVRAARAGEPPQQLYDQDAEPADDGVPVEMGDGIVVHISPSDVEELFTYQACPDQLRMLAHRYGQLMRFRDLKNPETPQVMLERQRALIRAALAHALAFITAVMVTEFNELTNDNITLSPGTKGTTNDEH